MASALGRPSLTGKREAEVDPISCGREAWKDRNCPPAPLAARLLDLSLLTLSHVLLSALYP